MMTSLPAMIGLTLATHPFQVLLAAVAIYHAAAALLRPRSAARNRPEQVPGQEFCSAA